MVNEAIIKDIFISTFNQIPMNITHIRDKGITNEVFIVEMSNQKLILRISQEPNTSQFEKEKWEMEQASQLGILTPKIFKVGSLGETIYMIEEYVEGIDGTESSLDRSIIWRKLGEYAKSIHSIPVVGFGDYMSSPGVFEGAWDKYLDYDIESLSESDILLSKRVLTIDQSKKIRVLFENLKKEELRFGLSHGDLSLKNVIVDSNGKVFLLDWGSSESQAIPYFDIIEVLQTSFKFEFQDTDFIAFLGGLGLSKEDFFKKKSIIDTLMLLRAIDHLRWSIDKKPEKVDHFISILKEVFIYMNI